MSSPLPLEVTGERELEFKCIHKQWYLEMSHFLIVFGIANTAAHLVPSGK